MTLTCLPDEETEGQRGPAITKWQGWGRGAGSEGRLLGTPGAYRFSSLGGREVIDLLEVSHGSLSLIQSIWTGHPLALLRRMSVSDVGHPAFRALRLLRACPTLEKGVENARYFPASLAARVQPCDLGSPIHRPHTQGPNKRTQAVMGTDRLPGLRSLLPPTRRSLQAPFWPNSTPVGAYGLQLTLLPDSHVQGWH